jgi:hypothetical protein
MPPNEITTLNLPIHAALSLPQDPTGTVLVDATDINNPKKIEGEYGFYYFAPADPHDAPELSRQWLTEMVVAPDSTVAVGVLADAYNCALETRNTPDALRLSTDANCTRGGRNVRLFRAGRRNLDERWNYLVVDATEIPKHKLVNAREIWLSKEQVLTPSLVNGKPLLSNPSVTIDGPAIAAKIAQDCETRG